MDNTVLYKIPYGVFVVTAKDGRKDNGCIINTAVQVANNPIQMSICINKLNYTHEMIQKTGLFTLSILDEDADYELYKHFGFLSGKDTDKFIEYRDCERTENGIYYLTKGCNAYISVKVEKTVDLGTHTMFIGIVTCMKNLNDKPSASYDYYLNNVKPKPNELIKSQRSKIIWRCRICGYEYEGEVLPDDFICPICKHPASDFEKVSTVE